MIYPESELGTDLPREIWPLARFVVDTFRETGELPLWRPYLLSGAPLIGHPVAPVLYPVHWLVLILSLPLALNLDAALHFWWAGVGTYLLLRNQDGLRWEAAFLGGLLFAHAPKWVAHLSGGHWPMLAAVAWLPWAWWAWKRYAATKRAWWSLLLGLALGCQALNDGRILALTGLWLTGASLAHLLRDRRRAARCLPGWALAAAVGFGLAAGQLLPLIELLPHTGRAGLSQAEAGFGSLPPLLTLAIFFPPTLKFPEWFVYAGAGALALSGVHLLAGTGRRRRAWLAGMALVLILSLGSHTPVHAGLLRLVPGLSLFRIPARWSIFFVFGFSILAAGGLHDWLEGSLHWTRRRRLALGGACLTYTALAALGAFLPGSLPFTLLPTAVALVSALLLLSRSASVFKTWGLAAIIVAELWWTAGALIRPHAEARLLKTEPHIAFLLSQREDAQRHFAPYGGVPESGLVAHGMRAVEGYDPFHLAAYAGLVRRAMGCDFEAYVVAVPPTLADPRAVDACPKFDPDAQLLHLLGVKLILAPESRMPSGGPTAQRFPGFVVHELTETGPPVFAVGGARPTTAETCLEDLTSIDPSQVALVEGALPSSVTNLPASVVDTSAGPSSFQARTSAANPSLLVRSEAWAPGWKAYVDGEPAQVLRVDCALQGVWVQAGEHVVEWRYWPSTYALGRWVSLATAASLCLLAVLAILHWVRKTSPVAGEMPENTHPFRRPS